MQTNAHYYLIIGMDVMQVIGLDLHNSSKTIVWNSNHVPFKSHDYFDDARLHESISEATDECRFDTIDDFFPMEIPSPLGQVNYSQFLIRTSGYT
jgi:hypothetical protein